MSLSKSKYTRGIQCPKMLWMERNMPDQFDPSILNSPILQSGNEVGDLAMGYFGDFVEIPFDPSNYDGMAEKTRELLEAGAPIICEATFSKDGNFCMVDILRVFDGYVEIVEVKSATKMKDINLHDIAYQTWLLRECGIDVRRASIMHLNSDYVRGEELEVSELFAVEDITDEIEQMISDVPDTIDKIKRVMRQTGEPSLKIGARCFKPYECGYRGWCWKDVPSPSAFDLYRMDKDKAAGYYYDGVSDFAGLIESGAIEDLTPRQQLQILAEENDEQHIEAGEISSFLDELWYPLCFFDFETFMPAVPLFPGTKPYQQVPSQYSLHTIVGEGAEVEHREFLAKEGTDPRREIAEAILRDIPVDACVIAWNMSFEKNRLKELADAFPDLAPGLMAIHDNVRDLIIPFRSGAYYTKEMHGSASIKAVLPALFPDDPELDYHSLEGVHNGGEASNAYLDLPNHTPEEIDVIREQLLRYCELDTLAMVKIWQRLKEIAAEAQDD